MDISMLTVLSVYAAVYLGMYMGPVGKCELAPHPQLYSLPLFLGTGTI